MNVNHPTHDRAERKSPEAIPERRSFPAHALTALSAQFLRHARGGPTGGNWGPLTTNQLRSVIGGPTGTPWLKTVPANDLCNVVGGPTGQPWLKA